MTDILEIARDIYDDIHLQYTNIDVGVVDLAGMVRRAIKELYNLTNRSSIYSESKFEKDETGAYSSFADDLTSVESSWVTYEAECTFFKRERNNYTDVRDYTTDAMSVKGSGDTYKNFSTTINELEEKKNVLLTRMCEHTILGVVG
jgi:hypothetical protein